MLIFSDNSCMINLTNSKKLDQTSKYYKNYIYRPILEDRVLSYNFIIKNLNLFIIIVYIIANIQIVSESHTDLMECSSK